ncbi:MAG: arginine--tRNA ligase, partial [Desulfobacula sp.]|uniref:arginine--tRNA ligase domain-containing protein n=1 Tax=Desulfobacula sp. TaxID=2593537 RepID=UPI0025C707B1
MKITIRKIILDAAQKAFEKGMLISDQISEMEIEEPRHQSQGDFSTNFAMVCASIQKMPPRKIAEILVSEIEISGKSPDTASDTASDKASGETPGLIEKVEIAGPGFINFFLSNRAWHPVIDTILSRDKTYGTSDMGKNEKVQVEFVSANPTGPLHVGHGRGAAVGDSVGNILSFAGFDVQKEFYINDSGRQIRTLGRSVWIRLQQIRGKEIKFPDDCYQGDYIMDLARKIHEKEGDKFLRKDEEQAIAVCAKFAAKKILKGIQQDLSDFGVTFDQWFSEQSLYDAGRVQKAIDDFKSKGLIYEEDGALWFRTQDFGDEKNRVVVRNNGLTTYFASDIAYHM